MRADRLLAILLLLQSRGRMTAQQLAERLEVSERTIYRDLGSLEAAGIPLEVVRGRRGGCALIAGYRTELMGLSAPEVRTLFVARAASHLQDLGLAAASDAALLKLLAAVPAEVRADAERALERIHLDADVWFQSAESVPYLSLVQDAIWRDRRLALTYRHSSGAIGERVVEPLGLVAKARVWYLVATHSDGTHVFRVGRIQRATLLDEQFNPPPDFDLHAFWNDWRTRFERSIPRYPARLLVSPEALPRLQTLLGEEVQIALDRASPPDAAGWREVPVAFERLDDARRAVLACGGQVEALAPAELRRGVTAAIDALAALHVSGDAHSIDRCKSRLC
jgi:predicted DNA-binding transcriptional regulator YafY